MRHVVVQLPSAPWLDRVADTVVAAWARSVDLTLEEIDDARLLLDEMLTALLEMGAGPVTMRLSSISLIVELSAPLGSDAGGAGELAVLRSSLRGHGDLPQQVRRPA